MLTAVVTSSGSSIEVSFLEGAFVGAEEGEEEVEVPESDLNPIFPELKEVAWGFGAFVILFVVLRLFLLPKIQKGMKSRYDSIQIQTNSNDIVTEQLAVARQALSAEQQRLLGAQYKSQNNLIGGIPVDSEYIIFVIDTSGSMFSYAWERMMQELDATLSIYPEVKGIQIMNDMGKYMFSRYRGQWIPDTSGRRKVIMQNLRNWNVFSNSSPVEGITAAIKTFYDPGKKISIFVFGDEFTGDSIARVIDTVDRINRKDAEGNRLVRIHAVGFPVQFIRAENLQTTGIRYATLMRELTYRNGGTFVGLNDFRP